MMDPPINQRRRGPEVHLTGEQGANDHHSLALALRTLAFEILRGLRYSK